MAERRFRFGITASRTPTGAEWLGLARRAEALGYTSLSLVDHFGDQFAPIAALTAAAVATTRLRVGAIVHSNDFRHPAILSNEIATIDVLSNGRAFLGLGAGWLDGDYRKSGIPLDPPGVRVERLQEAIAIIKRLQAAGTVDFQGRHYTLAGLDGRPKPVQQPHVPLLVGGGGRRVLSIAGREADIVSVNVDLRTGAWEPRAVALESSAEGIDQKIRWIRAAAGERFDRIELHLHVLSVTVGDRDAAARAIADNLGTDPGLILGVPRYLAGTIDEIVDTLRYRRDRYGFSFISIPSSAMDACAPVVERLSGA